MRSPITSDDFVSTFQLDDEKFTAYSAVSPKLIFLASRPDLWAFLAAPILIIIAWKFSGGPKYSPEFLYALALWSLIQSIYRITKRVTALHSSKRYELSRHELDDLMSRDEASEGSSGLYQGWVRVYVKPMPMVKAPPKVLPVERSLYLLRDNQVVRVLARSSGDSLNEAKAELAKLGLQTQVDEAERDVVLP
ncbi:MAG: hypothetical protein KDA31_10470 [Phycisphaerales bacterium]|nr:hypothetical protein [Phycisphaerales bacterium]